jgi:hypothetical protein
MAGINLLHVPYQGASPAPTDLLGGRADVMFEAMPTLVGCIQSGKLGPWRWERRCARRYFPRFRPCRNWASPKTRAASATRCLCIRSTRERAECDGQPQRSSITVYAFDRTAAFAGGGGEAPRHSAHSRIPTQSHRRSASSRFCSGPRSTDQHPNQSDKRAARTRSRIQLHAYRRALFAR